MSKRILIIDDELNILKSLKRVLEAEYTVEIAQGVKEAIKLFENNNPKFDVILCDFMMPEMTGEDFYNYIEKNNPQLSKNIVFMTGGKYLGSIQVFFDSHINFCLAKPFNTQELMMAINRVLEMEGS